jgi:hypothetical protein
METNSPQQPFHANASEDWLAPLAEKDANENPRERSSTLPACVESSDASRAKPVQPAPSTSSQELTPRKPVPHAPTFRFGLRDVGISTALFLAAVTFMFLKSEPKPSRIETFGPALISESGKLVKQSENVTKLPPTAILKALASKTSHE